jgi:hypothetical protein
MPWQISIRQNFRLNGLDHYTILDLPISVTNEITARPGRVPCDSINNPMLTPEQINMTAANNLPILFAPGDNTTVETNRVDNGGLGGNRPPASPKDGLGGADTLSWRSGAFWISLLAIALSIFG